MRKIILLAVILFAVNCTAMSQTNDHSKPILRHVVMFQFNEKATPADIKKIEDAFRALPSKIPEIKGFEWGTNNSPEKLNQGLTHCFLVSFASEKDRDAYLIHPAHKAFGAILGPFFGKATVLDYWAKQ